MTFFEKSVVTIFGIGLLCSLYVSASMNAIDDSYFIGITDFKKPFYIIRTLLLVFLLVSIVTCMLIPKYREQGFPLFRVLGATAFFVPLVVWVLGLSPCLYEHPHPHTLQGMIGQSLLCPSYSSRSYIWIIIIMFLGAITYFAANKWKLEFRKAGCAK